MAAIDAEQLIKWSVTMSKKLILLSVITTLGSVPFSGSAWGAEKSADQMEVKALLLAPAYEPVPAMAHRLLLRHSDQKAGNAALFYYSAAALCPDKDPDEVRKKIDEWRGLPTDQLPREEVEKVLAGFTNSLHYQDLAAQSAHCQWDMPLEDGYDLLGGGSDGGSDGSSDGHGKGKKKGKK